MRKYESMDIVNTYDAACHLLTSTRTTVSNLLKHVSADDESSYALLDTIADFKSYTDELEDKIRYLEVMAQTFYRAYELASEECRDYFTNELLRPKFMK